ncbi:small nuclear ribonucleoprotein G-like [Hippopotamus amphibius kiboko]|uniref:small nuclear ribonucleoprotein G-like n=1 Tax=Hippopotamus amphibius kiboko TaxID=575201 RepID=UPI0025962185|nr:small nuclear ribonucleoprotein G-like [Hippopotamus amphibius kiboko]
MVTQAVNVLLNATIKKWVKWKASLRSLNKHSSNKLKNFMKLSLKLNGGRHIQRILQEFNPFTNLVIDRCVEMATTGQQSNIEMVVIWGNSIIMLEVLEQSGLRVRVARRPDTPQSCIHTRGDSPTPT